MIPKKSRQFGVWDCIILLKINYNNTYSFKTNNSFKLILVIQSYTELFLVTCIFKTIFVFIIKLC